MANYAGTGDWTPLGTAFYRRVELYRMDWKASPLDSYVRIACASNGGPIALLTESTRNDSSTTTTERSTARRQTTQIDIYSASGRSLGSIAWSSGPLFDIGWTRQDEQLVCLQADGRCLVYSMQGKFQRVFSLGSDVEEQGVAECRFFESGSGGSTGIAVLTQSNALFVVLNVANPRVMRVGGAEAMPPARPTAWCVVPSTTSGADTRVVLACGESLYEIASGSGQSSEVQVPWSTAKHLTRVVLSPCRRKLAFFTKTGDVLIVGAELKGDAEMICEFNTRTKTQPSQLVWCGSDAVAGFWNEASIVLLVGAKKFWLNYKFDGFVTLVSEVDGMRVVGRYQHDYIHRVQAPLEAIFKIGSMSSGAVLFDAYRAFEEKRHQADEYLRMIK